MKIIGIPQQDFELRDKNYELRTCGMIKLYNNFYSLLIINSINHIKPSEVSI